MNGAVALPLDLNEIRITASGGSLVRRSVLPSGVRILTEHMPGAQSATVGFWVAVGSRDEQPVTYGSTHFLEHLLFKGTPSRTALDIAVSFDADHGRWSSWVRESCVGTAGRWPGARGSGRTTLPCDGGLRDT